MRKAFIDIKMIILKLMYILTPTQKRESLSVFLAMLMGSCLELLGVSILYPFLQVVVAPGSIRGKWYLAWLVRTYPDISNRTVIIILGVCIMFVFLLKNAGVLLSTYVQIRFSAKFYRELSTRMLSSYMKRPYEFFLNTNSSYIMRGIAGDVSSVYQIILCGFQIIAEVANVVLIGGYLIKTDPMIAGLSMAVALVCLLGITFGFKGVMKRAGKKMREAQTWQNRYSYQAIIGIKEITVLGRRKAFVDKYEGISRKVEKYTVSSNTVSAAPDRIIEGICMAGIMLVICFRLGAGMNMETFVPVMGVFAVGAFKLFPSVSKVSSRLNQIVFCMPGFNNAYNNLKEEEKYNAERNNESEGMAATSVAGDPLKFENIIRINDIYWHYFEKKENVLKGLSLTIKKGESIGLIGSSGAGKSTLADIIMGLFQPQRGTVEVDGVDIFSAKDKWIKLVGYVPQSIFLVDDTVRCNVAFGLEEKDISDEKVWKALERAQIKEFIKKLPDGLDTMVGEFGLKFSGGQRQRIAIARALYDSPEVLILDEATAALDNDTENALMESIESLQGTITMIIVAHRLTTIRECDHIYEIKDGIAVERSKTELNL